jgi:hypothetical protein
MHFYMHSYLHKILFLKKKKVGVTLDQYGGSLPTWLHYSRVLRRPKSILQYSPEV